MSWPRYWIARSTDCRHFFASAIAFPFHFRLVKSRRIAKLSDAILRLLGDDQLVGLDVGCGSGEISQRIECRRPGTLIVGVDVVSRGPASIRFATCDGRGLPFRDRSVDFVMLIDVLHHADDSASLLREAARVSRGTVIVKDHQCESVIDRWCLLGMDWFGNAWRDRAWAGHYLSSASWRQLFREVNVAVDMLDTKLDLYRPPVSWIFGRRLHFIARLGVQETSVSRPRPPGS